jgi:transcriptional regulator with XRE-family HTH domain
MARWRPVEEYTPLAQRLVHYMWEQRPPLLPAQFADKVGVSRQLISRVLNQDTAPEPSALLRMARVMQLPSQTLFRAAGYTTDAEPIYTYDEAWESVMGAILTDSALVGDMRELLGPLLEHAREQHRPGAQRQVQPPGADELAVVLDPLSTDA